MRDDRLEVLAALAGLQVDFCERLVTTSLDDGRLGSEVLKQLKLTWLPAVTEVIPRMYGRASRNTCLPVRATISLTCADPSPSLGSDRAFDGSTTAGPAWRLVEALLRLATLLPLLGYPFMRAEFEALEKAFTSRRADVDAAVAAVCARVADSFRIPETKNRLTLWALLLLQRGTPCIDSVYTAFRTVRMRAMRMRARIRAWMSG